MLTVDGGSGVYVYDAFGRPDAFTDAGRSALPESDRRIEKTTSSGSLVYLYDVSGQEIAEVDTSGNNVEDDIWAGSRHLAMYYSNSTYFFNADQVGTERVATDPTGAVAQTCINMPYGDDFSCTGSLPTGRFAGYDTNDEYGLAHAPARYYSPALGRFVTPDPLGSAPLRSPAGSAGAHLPSTLNRASLTAARASSASTGPTGGAPVKGGVTRYTILTEPAQTTGQAHASALLLRMRSLTDGQRVACPIARLALSLAGLTGENPQALNTYAYALNQPVTRSDPQGTLSKVCASCILFAGGCIAGDILIPGSGIVDPLCGLGLGSCWSCAL